MGLKRTSGFTLIEVLVSMAVFAVGMLGIGLYLARGMAASVDNQVHASAMRVAQQAIEPLYLAIREDRDAFRAALASFVQNGQSPLFDSGNPVDQAFTVNLTTARDQGGQPLLGTPPASWQPPFQVVFTVQYQSAKTTRSFPIAHVFVPTQGNG